MEVDESKYVDQRENPKFLLTLTDEGLLMRLGVVVFQIEQYGYYNPDIILKADFTEKGKEAFRKYAGIIKQKLCRYYKSMRESGVLDTAEKTYFFVIGYLMAIDVQRAIAVGVAAIIAKQGLHSICKEEK